MNTAHLSNIQNVLDNSVLKGKISGANCLIFKDGKELGYWESGLADIEAGVPFKRNTICRLYSMSKPVTSVGVLKLLEEGKIDLDQCVSEYLPEFQNLKVCDNGKIRKSWRPLKIQDLMNMTSGYTYGGDDDEGRRQTSRLIGELNEHFDTITTREFARRIAEIPVTFEPGTSYEYGFSADILGALIEAVSGKKFSQYMKENIFDPLGMKDTGYWVPASEQKRLSKVYRRPSDGTNHPTLFTNNNLGIQDKMDKEPAFESGGAGLVSTIDDYMRFVRMLVNGGELDGVRILQEGTVRFMSTAKLRTNLQQVFDCKMEHLSGYSYTNLCRVCIEPDQCKFLAQKGEFGWDGWLGPYMMIDPVNKIGLVYLQQMCDSGLTDTMREIRNILYSAM